MEPSSWTTSLTLEKFNRYESLADLEDAIKGAGGKSASDGERIGTGDWGRLSETK